MAKKVSSFEDLVQKGIVNPAELTDLYINTGSIPNLSEYQRLGVKDISLNNLETGYTKLARAQPWYEQGENATKGFGKLAVAGFVEMLSTSWDFGKTFDAIKNVQRDYADGWAHDFSNDMRESVQMKNPIYAYDPEGVNPFSDFAWTAGHLQQLGYSAGIGLEMIAENVALNLATGGAAAGLGISKAGLTLSKLSKMPGMWQKAKYVLNSSSNIKKLSNVAQGLLSGAREAELNMYHTSDEIYNDFINKGYSEEEAKMYASKGAAEAFRSEVVPSMMFNLAQFSMLGYNPMKGQLINKGDMLFDGIKNTYLRGTSKYAAQAVSEGFEEVWQGMAAVRGKEYADYLAGDKADYSFFSKEYLGSNNMWNEFIGGALGGVFFESVGTLANKLTNKGQEKTFKSAISSSIKDIQERKINQLAKLKVAIDNNDYKTAYDLESDINFYTWMSSKHMDSHTDGRTNQFQAEMTMAEALLEAANKGDIQEIQRIMPIPDVDIDMLKEKLPKFIEAGKEINRLYDNNVARGYTGDAIVPITYREFEIEQNQKTIAEIDQRISELESTTPFYTQLSNVGKQRADLKLSKKALNNNLNTLNLALKQTKDENRRKAIQETIDEINTKIKLADSILENESELYDEDDTNIFARDNKLLEQINSNQAYDDLIQTKENIITDNELMLNELKMWRDPVYQSQFIQTSIQNSFDKAETKEELTGFLKELEDKNLKTKEWVDRVKQKEQILEKKENEKKSSEKKEPKFKPEETGREIKKPTVKQEIKKAKKKERGTIEEEVVPDFLIKHNSKDIADKIKDSGIESLNESEKSFYNYNDDIKQSIDYLVNKKNNILEKIDDSSTLDEQETKNQKDKEDTDLEAKIEDTVNKAADLLEKLRQSIANTQVNQTTGEVITKTPNLLDIIQDSVTDDDISSFLALPISEDLFKKYPALSKIFMELYRVFPGFEEAIDSFTDRSVAKTNFDLFKKGYQVVQESLDLPLLSENDFNRIYNKRFRSIESFLEQINDILNGENQNEINDSEEKDLQKSEEQSKQEGSVKDNLSGTYKGLRINDATPKLGYKHILTKIIRVGDNIIRKIVNNNVVKNKFTDPTPLLDINAYPIGTKLIAEIPVEADDIPIDVYNFDGRITYQIINGRRVPLKSSNSAIVTGITFGEAKKRFPEIETDSDLNTEYTPIMIRDSRFSKGIAFIHDPNWWRNTNNIGAKTIEEQLDIQKEAIDNVIEQRKYVIEHGGRAELEVISKGYAKLDDVTDENNNFVHDTVNNRNPDTVEISMFTDDQLFKFGNQNISLDQIVNNNWKFQSGGAYLLFPVGKKGNKIMYEVRDADTVNTGLKQEIIDSFYNIIELYINNIISPDPENSKILQELGITDNYSVSRYINQFITPLPAGFEGNENSIANQLANIANNSDSKLQPGTLFFQSSGNSLTIFKVDTSIVDLGNGKTSSFISIPTQPSTDAQGNRTFGRTKRFLQAFMNRKDLLQIKNTTEDFPIRLKVDKQKIESKLPVKGLEKTETGQYKVTEISPSYSSLIKDMFTTTVAGIQGSDGKTYSANQPVIQYKITGEIQKPQIVQSPVIESEVFKKAESKVEQTVEKQIQPEEQVKPQELRLQYDFNPTNVSEDYRQEASNRLKEKGFILDHIETPTEEELGLANDIVIHFTNGKSIVMSIQHGVASENLEYFIYERIKEKGELSDIKILIGIGKQLEDYIKINPSEALKIYQEASLMSSAAKELYGEKYDINKDVYAKPTKPSLSEQQRKVLSYVQNQTITNYNEDAIMALIKHAFPDGTFDEFFNSDGTLKDNYRISDSNQTNFALPRRINNAVAAELSQSEIGIPGLTKSQHKTIINYLTGKLTEKLYDSIGEKVNKRELYNEINNNLSQIVNTQLNTLRNQVSEFMDLGFDIDMLPVPTQQFINRAQKDISALETINNNMNQLLNNAMDVITQKFDLKQIDSKINIGDIIMRYEIDAEYQSEFNINEPITLLEYNDNDTLKVKQGDKIFNVTLSNFDNSSFELDNSDTFDTNQDNAADDNTLEGNEGRSLENWQMSSSLERDPKKEMNGRTKLLIETLEQKDSRGNTIEGDFRLTQYGGLTNYWKRLQSILTNNTMVGTRVTEVDENSIITENTKLTLTSDYNQMIQKLENAATSEPWIKDLINKLNSADQSVKNAFVTDMYKYAISMKKVYVRSIDNKNKVSLIDTNSNEIRRLIENRWRSNLSNKSPLTTNIGNKKTYNINAINEVLRQYDELKIRKDGKKRNILSSLSGIKDITKLSLEQKQWVNDLHKWLNNLGLELDIQTLNYLILHGMKTSKISKINTPFRLLFEGSAARIQSTKDIGKGRLFAALEARLNYIKEITEQQNIDLTDQSKQIDFNEQAINHLYYGMNSILNKLSRIESFYDKTNITASFREGKKTINGISNFNFLTQHTEELKSNNNRERTNKLGMVYDKHSFDLQLLEDPEYQDQFDMSYSSPDALKVADNNYDVSKNKITDLADIDYEFTKLAGMMYTQQGEVTLPQYLIDKYPNLRFRIASLFNPTSSDKDQVFYWKKAVIDFIKENFVIDEGKITGVQNYIKEFFISQTVVPELDRIINHHKTAKAVGKNPNQLYNQDGYNLAAQHFIMIPAMNYIMIDNQYLPEYIRTQIEKGIDINVEKILSDINENLLETITELIDTNVENKINVWKKNGYLQGEGNKSSIKHLDVNYFNSSERTYTGLSTLNNEEKLRALAYEFEINNMIANANYNMIYTGDLANYASEKMYKSEYFETINGQPIISRPKEEYKDIFIQLAVNGQLDTNIGKRLAAMIAPRSAIANSQFDKYIQIVVQDNNINVGVETLSYLIKLYHGQEALNSAQDLLDQLQDYTYGNYAEDIKMIERKKIISALAKQFPDLKDHMNITSTDGQELTTWKEHLDTIMNRGRLSDEIYKKAQGIYDKLSKGEELDTSELDLIFQPIKPVHNGHNYDDGYTKMMYIKTSSYPLLPQITKAFPNGMDKVRKMMEDIQEKKDRNVRLVYASGIKAGLPRFENLPKMWNSDGTFNDNIIDKLDESSLVLDRKYWGIQQDTPYKSGFRNEDKVTLVTQAMKMLPTLLTNLIHNNSDTEFVIDGKTHSAQELFDKLNNHFGDWISTEKRSLYQQLDVNPKTGQPNNPETFVRNVSNLLLQEAKARGTYSPQDIEAIKVIMDQYDNAEFVLPIYLSPNSFKYEGLLNSIIANRLIKLKMPGNAYIVASQDGYISNILETVKSNVVFSKNFDGELKSQRLDADGNVLPAQVMCSSKFRLSDGTMINLLEKDKNGNYIYVTQNEQGSFFINEEMIDPEVLNLNSFRIPYSGAQSGPIVEIVAFLPEAAGDLMIVPRDHLVTMGEDFDVDKRYTYQLWNYKDSQTRKIQKIEKKFGDFTGQELINIITSARNYIDEYKNYLEELDVLEEQSLLDEAGIDSVKQAINGLYENILKDINLLSAKNLKQVVGNILPNFQHLEKIYPKLLQNEIIKSYQVILSSNDESIQKEINQVLSTAEMEEQGQLLESIRQGKIDKRFSSILSSEYQKTKMKAGSTAKMGIAAYSNALVLHNMIQQADKSIKLQQVIVPEDGNYNNSENVNVEIVFGNIISDGTLGIKNPIKPSDTSESFWNENIKDTTNKRFNQLQNVSTDNEKLQLFSKLGLNEITVNVDIIMTQLGIVSDFINLVDENGNNYQQKISLPHFLISQPIIKDFVTRLQNKTGNLSEFDLNADKAVLQEIINENDVQEKWNAIQSDKNTTYKALTGQTLYNELYIQNIDNQLAALSFFLEMKDYMFVLSKNYSSINIQSSKLGKSIFDVQNVSEGFESLTGDTIVDKRVEKGILNFNTLIGEFITEEEYDNLDNEKRKGFEQYKSFFFKPTTINGHMIYNSIISHNQLFSRFYPFGSQMFNAIFDDILNDMGYYEKSKVARTELKQVVFNEIKKYIFTNPDFGLYSGDIKDIREKLLKDYRNFTEKTVRNNITLSDDLFKTANQDNLINASQIVLALPIGNTLFTFQGDFNEAKDKTGSYVLKKENNQLNLYKLESVTSKLSLTTYLQNITDQDSPGAKLIKNNVLIQDFTYNDDDISTNEGVSFMRYKTVSEKNYDQDDVYNAITELIINDLPLNDVEGWERNYSTRKLAEDLIIHAYLNQGGVQSAIEYVKNIPLSILDHIEGSNGEYFSQKLRNIQKMFSSSAYENSIKELFGFKYDDVSRLHRQIVQHNPKHGKKIRSKQYRIARNKLTQEEIEDFGINKKDNIIEVTDKNLNKQKMLVEYNSSQSPKTYKIYEQLPVTRGRIKPFYREIPTLGNSFISEYDAGNDYADTLMKDTTQPKPTSVEIINKNSAPVTASTTDADQLPFSLKDGKIIDVINSIANAGLSISPLAEVLKTMPLNPNIKFEAGKVWKTDISTAGTTIVYNIDTILTEKSDEIIASYLLHEIIHSLTTQEFNKYFNRAYEIDISRNVSFREIRNGKDLYKEMNPPSHIGNIGQIFLQANKAVKSMFKTEAEYNKVVNKIKELIRKQANDEVLTNEDQLNELESLVYATLDIYEFNAQLTSDLSIIRKFNNITYGNNPNSIITRFKEALIQVLNALGLDLKHNSIAAQGINAIYDFIEETGKQPKTNIKVEKNQIQTDKTIDKLIAKVDNLVVGNEMTKTRDIRQTVIQEIANANGDINKISVKSKEWLLKPGNFTQQLNEEILNQIRLNEKYKLLLNRKDKENFDEQQNC